MLHELEPVANFGFARRFELSTPLGLFLSGRHGNTPALALEGSRPPPALRERGHRGLARRAASIRSKSRAPAKSNSPQPGCRVRQNSWGISGSDGESIRISGKAG